MTIDAIAQVKTLVEDIARLLVDKPGEVSVEVLDEASGSTMLELTVAPDEVGKVIGKQGRTIRSIRNIMDAASRHHSRRYTLEIAEPEPGNQPSPEPQLRQQG